MYLAMTNEIEKPAVNLDDTQGWSSNYLNLLLKKKKRQSCLPLTLK